MYDFKKRKLDDPRIACYHNPYFKKDRIDLLQYIKRQTHKSHPKRQENQLLGIARRTRNSDPMNISIPMEDSGDDIEKQ